MPMTQRPIHRPNSFTPEEWDRLSREEQIQWWEKQQPEAEHLGPFEAVLLYRKGHLTAGELPVFVFDHLTDEHGRKLFAASPYEVLQLLRRTAASLPADDDEEGWRQLVRIESVCYPPWVTEEEIRRSRQDRDRRFREGVRIFRKLDHD
jgi:hypothetical protein